MADTYLEPNIPRNRPQAKTQPRAPEPDSEPEQGPKLSKRKPHREEVPVDEPDVSGPASTKPRETWFERNRNLIFFGIAILIVLVILLIWHLFSRQPTPRVVVVPGQGSRAAPPKAETAVPAAPSENVDEAVPAEPAEKSQSEAEQERLEEAHRGKPVAEPKAKPAASNNSKSKTAQAEPKTSKSKPRTPVAADTIVTADDEEINKFAGMSAEASEPGKME